MRPINLLSLIQAHRSLDAPNFQNFTSLHGIELRDAELRDVRCLVETLQALHLNASDFEEYFVGYTIAQIGKEFDLLRFGSNYNINIEIKSDCDEAKILRQLLRNRYYLKYLSPSLYNIAFSSLNQNFYLLNADDTLSEIGAEQVSAIMLNQCVEKAKAIDESFRPSNYLVSPFNTPEKFLSQEYFLTSHQEHVKTQIMALMAGSHLNRFTALTGAAGTGKTLLAYDIVAALKAGGKNLLLVHCGNLNNGHRNLIDAGWTIIPAKALNHCDLQPFDIILIDEAQRIYTHQFDRVVAHTQQNNRKCLFSYDKSQTLADSEARNDLAARIAALPGITNFALSDRIRTNKEIATFLKGFLNNSRGLKTPNTGNIEVVYFDSINDAKNYIDSVDATQWKVLRFTPSQYKNEHHESYSNVMNSTSHEVIGQEFDQVAVAVDRHFSYNQHGNLVYTGTAYYQPAKMLFQNVTRARNKLRLIIIENPAVLQACMRVLQ